MKQYDPSSLVIHPDPPSGFGFNRGSSSRAGRLGYDPFPSQPSQPGRPVFTTEAKEAAIILLSGKISIESNRGSWARSADAVIVFSGLPFALYLPIHSEFIVKAITACEFAIARIPATTQREPKLVTPEDVRVEIRGGDHATRQINQIIPPGFPCDRLVVVEVYTPGGNWSSYPPHKHDVRKVRSGWQAD